MPGAVRAPVDMCTGHGPCGSRMNISGSSNVFINNYMAHRVGDPWVVHCTHPSVQASGSPNVFVNGQALARIGDAIACGSSNLTGSQNVLVNEKG